VAKHPREIPVAVQEPRPGREVPVSHIDTAGAPDSPEAVDPNHHLWRNGRLWWIAFTAHRGYQQERVRFSLRTDDVEVARERRDALFALYESAERCQISLRFQPRRRSAAGRNCGNQRRSEGCA
jgi:hypothetical protein